MIRAVDAVLEEVRLGPDLGLYYGLLILYDVFLVAACSAFYRPLIEE